MTLSTNTDETCPCSSGKPFTACCSPVLEGKRTAATAEDLLRARYTAFTCGKVDFIIKTHHSRTRDELNREEIESWSRSSRWLGLNIVEKEAGSADDAQGRLVFCARYISDGKIHEHWEKSLFEKEGNDWRFVDAEPAKQVPVRRADPKTGRNDPCSCGSGKKHKKCCGAGQ